MPYVRLLAAQVAVGAAAIFARWALTGAGPLAVSALRLLVAAALALALARGPTRLSRGRELAFGLAGLALAAHFALWIGSLLLTSVAVSTLLVTTTPVWTELYDAIRLRRPPSRAYLAALALSLAGVALVASRGDATPAPVPHLALLGDALALGGSVAIGAYLVLVRAAGAEPRGARLPTFAIVARTYTWAALALVAASAALRQGPPAIGDGLAWGGVLAMALVSQSVGHTLLNGALRDFAPSTIALATLLEPVVAGALAAVAFRESVGPGTLAGGALVIAGVAIALRAASPPVAGTAAAAPATG